MKGRGRQHAATQTSCPLLKTFSGTGKYTSQSIAGITQSTQFLASVAVGNFYFDASGSRSKQDVVLVFLDTPKAHGTTPVSGSRIVALHCLLGACPGSLLAWLTPKGPSSVATHVTIVPSGAGVKTAFPTIL
ncbi:MAG: hypothetical protein QM755_02410 [Luteolibacter sp.]